MRTERLSQRLSAVVHVRQVAMEEDRLGSRLAVSRLQPLSNADSWQRSGLGPAKDAAIREEHRRSGGIHGLNGR